MRAVSLEDDFGIGKGTAVNARIGDRTEIGEHSLILGDVGKDVTIARHPKGLGLTPRKARLQSVLKDAYLLIPHAVLRSQQGYTRIYRKIVAQSFKFFLA